MVSTMRQKNDGAALRAGNRRMAARRESLVVLTFRRVRSTGLVCARAERLDQRGLRVSGAMHFQAANARLSQSRHRNHI